MHHPPPLAATQKDIDALSLNRSFVCAHLFVGEQRAIIRFETDERLSITIKERAFSTIDCLNHIMAYYCLIAPTKYLQDTSRYTGNYYGVPRAQRKMCVWVQSGMQKRETKERLALPTPRLMKNGRTQKRLNRETYPKHMLC